MGYRGYVEHLCPRGHHHEDHSNGYEAPVELCPECKQPWTWQHSVDLTNGSDSNNPRTMPAPKERFHQDVQTETDAKGRQFLRVVDCFNPAPNTAVWKRCTDPVVTPLQAPNGMRNWHFEIHRADADLRAQVRAFLADNWIDSPAYHLNKRAGSFLQGDSDFGRDDQGAPVGWMQIEFWSQDTAAMGQVREAVLKMISARRLEALKQRWAAEEQA